MPELARQALLPFSQGAVYHLVNDVERYPEFVPGCAGVVVLSRSEAEVVATVQASARGFSEAFTTRNRLSPSHRIDLELVEGPFRSLRGEWLFAPLGDAGCKVSLRIDYEFGGLLGRTLKPMMGRAADTVLDAFVARARAVLS